MDNHLFYKDYEGVFLRELIVDDCIKWLDSEVQIDFSENCIAQYITINEENICTMKFRQNLAYKREGEPFYLMYLTPKWVFVVQTKLKLKTNK